MYALDIFLKILLDIDFFGIKPKFNINNKYSYGTYYGAIVSIFICILLSIIFFMQFFKIILHSEPTLITTIYNDEDPKKLNITPNNFILTFSLQDINYNNYINESIYFVSASLANVNLYPNGTNHLVEKNLSLIKCSDYNFSLIPDYFKNLPLNNLYCINESLISIQGQFKKNIWSYINLRFYICNKTEDNLNKCASENEIKSRLNGGYIGIFMTDFNVIPTNFSNPSNIFGTNVYNSFSIKNHVDYWMYLKPIEVITDNGYFMENKKKDDFFGLDYSKSDIYYLDDNSNFLTIIIRVSPRRDVYERSYLKIQGAAATIGGMINLSIFIGELITYFFNLTLYKHFFLQFFNTEEKLFKYQPNKVKIRKLKSHRINSNIRPKLNTNNNNSINKRRIKVKSENNLNNVISLKKDNKNLNTEKTNLNNNKDNNNSLIKNDSKQNLNIILYNDYLNENNYINNDDNNIEKKQIKYKVHYSNNLLKIKNLKNMYNFRTRASIFNINNQNLNKIKNDNKTLILNSSNNNLIENEIDNNKNNNNIEENSIFSSEVKFPIINFRQKRLKKYVFCTKIFCRRRCCLKVSDIHKNFSKLNFLFDLIHFLKTKNEINLIKNEIYNHEQKRALNTMYTFDSDFYHEKLAYDLIIIEHKN